MVWSPNAIPHLSQTRDWHRVTRVKGDNKKPCMRHANTLQQAGMSFVIPHDRQSAVQPCLWFWCFPMPHAHVISRNLRLAARNAVRGPHRNRARTTNQRMEIGWPTQPRSNRQTVRHRGRETRKIGRPRSIHRHREMQARSESVLYTQAGRSPRKATQHPPQTQPNPPPPTPGIHPLIQDRA